MARPKKRTSDRREQWIKARVSPAEHASFLTRAARARLSPSEFLRESALSSPQVVVAEETPQADFELTDQLRRIGVNLNQLTRVANKTGYMPDGLDEALAKVDQLLDRMMSS